MIYYYYKTAGGVGITTDRFNITGDVVEYITVNEYNTILQQQQAEREAAIAALEAAEQAALAEDYVTPEDTLI